MNSPPLCCPLFIYLLNFFSLLSNGLTSVFLLFDLVGTALAVLTHFFKCLQLLFLAICSRHIGLCIFFAPEKNNNKQTNDLTNGSQIWEDSDLQMSLITSAALPIFLSLPRSLSYPTISSPSVSLSTWQRLSAQSVCSGCVWTYACMCVSWLWARSHHRASVPVCYGPHMAAKCGRFGQGSCTFTSICKQITEKNNYSVWTTDKKSARMLS